MSRPIVVECDGCGLRVEWNDYGTPEGWVKVKAVQSRTSLSEAEAEFCGTCALCVDTVRLAKSGRPWAGTAKPKTTKTTKRKSKAQPEVEVEIEGEVDPDALAEDLLDGLDHGE